MYLTLGAKRCIETVPATSTHSLEQCRSIPAIRRGDSCIVTMDSRRSVKIQGCDPTILVTLKVLEVAVLHNVSSEVVKVFGSAHSSISS